MTGFGVSPFGSIRFGISDLGDASLWKSLPRLIRNQDEDGYLHKLYVAMQEEFNLLADKILHSQDQVDPLQVTGFETIDIDLESSREIIDDYWGHCVEFTCASGQDLECLGIRWTFTINDKDVYTVVRVKRRNEPENKNIITALGKIKPNPDVVLGHNYTFNRPSMLKLLYKNYGYALDSYDTEQYQRGMALNGLKLLSQKSNYTSYTVRGEYAGWNVDVQSLWHITQGIANMLPPSNVYFVDDNYYTNIEPYGARFDDIRSDMEFIDPDLGLVGLLDNYLIYDDTSGDTMSPAKYFSQNILVGNPPTSTALNLISVTPLTPSELNTYMLQYGFRVEVSMTQLERDKMGWISEGIFALKSTVLGEEYFIDREIYYDSLLNIWTIIIDEPLIHAPLITDTFGIKYYPEPLISCDWCKSSKFYVVMQLISTLPYGSTFNEAVDRMILKIENFMPIHCEIVGYTAIP